jgi:hypothetical protein
MIVFISYSYVEWNSSYFSILFSLFLYSSFLNILHTNIIYHYFIWIFTHLISGLTFGNALIFFFNVWFLIYFLRGILGILLINLLRWRWVFGWDLANWKVKCRRMNAKYFNFLQHKKSLIGFPTMQISNIKFQHSHAKSTAVLGFFFWFIIVRAKIRMYEIKFWNEGMNKWVAGYNST